MDSHKTGPKKMSTIVLYADTEHRQKGIRVNLKLDFGMSPLIAKVAVSKQ